MGAGAAASKKYGVAEPSGAEAPDGVPKKQGHGVIHAKAKASSNTSTDNDAWRAPKEKKAASSLTGPIRGPKPPAGSAPRKVPAAPAKPMSKITRPDGLPFRDEAVPEDSEKSTWSPRQGGLSKREREEQQTKKKEKEAAEKMAAKFLAIGGLPPLPVGLEGDADRDGNDGLNPKARPMSLSLEDAAAKTAASAPPGPTLLSLAGPTIEEDPTSPPVSPAKGKVLEVEWEEPDLLPADYEGLADVADRAWKELLVRVNSSNLDDLFLFNELMDSVEAAEKRLNGVKVQAARAYGATQRQHTRLDKMCEGIQNSARHPKIGAAYPWKRSDLAVRRKIGLCEVISTHRIDGRILRVEVRMISSDNCVSVFPQDLVPLTRGEQEKSVRKQLEEIEVCKREQGNVDREIAKVHLEQKMDYQKLSERLDRELAKHDLEEVVRPCGVPSAPAGMPTMDLVGQWAGKPVESAPMPAYPNMAGLLSAAEALLQAAPKVLSQAQPKTVNSLTNSAVTQDSDPTVVPHNEAPLITRDMLPTPMRYQSAEDEDPTLEATPQVFSSIPLEETLAEEEEDVDGGEWVAYEDDDGDTYYHCEETDQTAWVLPRGARLRPPEDELPEPASAPTVLEPAAEALRPGLWQNISVDFELQYGSPSAPSLTSPMAARPAVNPIADRQASKENASSFSASVPTASFPSATVDEVPQLNSPQKPLPQQEQPHQQASALPQSFGLPQPGAQTFEQAYKQSHGPPPQLFPDPEPQAQPQSYQPQSQPEPKTYASEPPPLEEACEWVRYETAEGAPYYHNATTGETRWDLPAGASFSVERPYVPEEEPVAAQAAEQQWSAATQQQWSQPAAADQQQWSQPHAATQQQWNQQAVGQQQFAQQQAATQQQWYQQQQAGAQQQAAAQQQNQWAQYGQQMAQQQYAQQAATAQQEAQQQQDQWAQYYQQYWTWYQAEQETRQKQGAPEPDDELAPPPPNATVPEQLAFAMKTHVYKEMQTMLAEKTTLAERKKALKIMQVKWHPDKNPEQLDVAKGVFQMLGEKKEWFLFDDGPDLELEVAQVD